MLEFLSELVAWVAKVCAYIVAAFVVVAVFSLCVVAVTDLERRVKTKLSGKQEGEGESDDAP